ncbi:MAG: NAD-glutamate dehydrogenase [Proteobacteria bacterium]|nr:NAD-glutamate dehydrogenase [Pseudomonadota bacterium]
MDAAARAEISPSADQFVVTATSGPWPGFKNNGAVDPSAEVFLRGLYADASPDELADLSLDDLTALGHDLWSWRSERKPDEQLVRIRRGVGVGGRHLDRDILEVVGPDMPFLVDSVMGELADEGITTLALFHPVAPSNDGRGKDSLIQIHFQRLSAQRAKTLVDNVRSSLKDVRAAVADFQAMRQRMLAVAEELQAAKANASREDVAEAVELLRWLAADKFTFLGARDYAYHRDASGAYTSEEPEILCDTCLGVLRDVALYVLRTSDEPVTLTPELNACIAALKRTTSR